MTSVLAQQLASLAAGDVQSGRRLKGKPSLLYDVQQAANVDLQTIYNIAVSGFKQLCGLDWRFQDFSDSLFSLAALALNRDQITAEENAELSASIRPFLELLSNYFLTSSAFKTLEFLIRRFRVNEFNVDDLVLCALPYHATNEFVRLVQTLKLGGTNWQWLAPMQDSGAPMPRDVLVRRCLNDQAVLNPICAAAKEFGAPASANRTYLSFYAVLMCEVLATAPRVTEDIMTRLLPYLLAGLRPRSHPDYRAATLMIITQLTTRATLSNDLLTVLLTKAGDSTDAADTATYLMVLAHIAATQPQLTSLPAAVLKTLFHRLPQLAYTLATLAEKRARLQPLLHLLLPALLDESLTLHDSGSNRALELLLDVIHRVPLEALARDVTDRLLQAVAAAAAGQDNSATSDHSRSLLRALELRYPDEVDAAVTDALQAQEEGAAKQTLFGFVQAALAGSSRAPVDADNGLSLARAVDSAAAGMRAMALQKLDTLAQASGPSSEAGILMHDSLLRRLADDDASVVLAALDTRAIVALPPAEALAALTGVLDRANAAYAAGAAHPRHQASKEVIRKVLAQLVRLANSAGDATIAARCAAHVTEFLLADKLHRDFSTYALALAAALPQQLFHVLLPAATAGEAAAEPADEAAASSKAGRRGKAGKKKSGGEEQTMPQPVTVAAQPAAAATAADSGRLGKAELWAHNRQLVALLSVELAKSAGAGDELCAVLSHAGPRCRHLLLLVAHAAFVRMGAKPPARGAVPAWIGSLTQQLTDAVTTGSIEAGAVPFADLLAQVTDKEGLPNKAHHKELADNGTAISNRALQLHVLHDAVSALPMDGLPGGHGGLFLSLAAVEPAAATSPHLSALLDKVPIAEAREFLSTFYAAPLGAVPTPAVQLAALQLLHQRSDTLPVAFERPSWAWRLLAAASSDNEALRTAALAAAAKCLPAVGDGGHTTAAASVLQRLVSGQAADPAGVLRAACFAAASGSGPARGAGTEAAAPSVVRAALLLQLAHEVAAAADGGGGDAAHPRFALLTDAARLRTALLVLQALRGQATDGEVLRAGLPALAAALLQPHLPGAESAARLVVDLQLQLRRQLLACYSADALAGGASDELLEPLMAALQPAAQQQRSAAAAAVLRAAAIQQLTPPLFSALPALQQQQALGAVLVAAASDDHDTCRGAARRILEVLPLTTPVLLPFLQPGASEGAAPSSSKAKPAAKKAKRAGATDVSLAATDDAPPSAALTQQALDLAVAVLEMLQWRTDLPDEAALAPALLDLLQRLLPSLGSIVSTHDESVPAAAGAGAADDDEAGTQAAAATGAIFGYAAQLVLAVLTRIAGAMPAKATRKVFKVELIVQLAQRAPDAAVRNAALSLLAAVAIKMPEATLQHVLQVLSLLHAAAAPADSYSQQVANSTLSAVVPAWLSAGKDPAALWSHVLDALPDIPQHRRLGLLSSMLDTMQQEEPLSMALGLMLRRAAAAAGSATAASSSTPTATQAASTPEAAEQDWLLDLAAALALQVSGTARLRAFAGVLKSFAADFRAYEAAPRLAVGFITGQVKLKGLQADARTANAAAADAADPAADPAASFSDSGAALMQQALMQMHQLNTQQLQAAGAARKVLRGARSATRGLYELLAALQAVMEPEPYLQALLQLASHPEDRVRRRALKLFGERVQALPADLADLDLLPAAQRQPRQQAIADAALAICDSLGTFFPAAGNSQQEQHQDAMPSAFTRQMAVLAVDATARQLGTQHAARVLSCVPQVVAAVQDPHGGVRASALACIATSVRALGPQLLPQLPHTVKAVLAAAQAALEGMAGTGTQQKPSQEHEGSDVEADEEEGGAASTRGGAEQRGTELAAALAAVEALVAILGAFLSPYIGSIMGLLLRPEVLSCQTAGCAQFAADIRKQLPSAVPARLLLAPVFGQWDPVLAAAAASSDAAPPVQLLGMLAATAGGMDSKTAAAYHEQLFGFLLRALDTRQQGVLDSDATSQVEAAAVAALVALVMKLNEMRFKPMFLRLLEWGGAMGGGAAAAGGSSTMLGRSVALYSAVNALAERLRSVFVPYYRYLMDSCMQHLSTGASSGRPSKKRRKSQPPAEGDENTGTQEQRWLLRLKVVRALHRCFLYDTVAFMDQDRFDRLLPALVAQLESAPAVGAQQVLTQQGADTDLDSTLTGVTAVELGLYGRAVVGALVQMALAAGSDAFWKPLNHQVLMVTRSSDATARLLALEVVAQLVSRLREEYLLLLPETIPFLSELLEDVEPAVEARAQQVVAVLEEVSGEKLDQYLKP